MNQRARSGRGLHTSLLLAVASLIVPWPTGHDRAVAAAQSSSLQAGSLPRVRMIATGGTISNRVGGRLSAAELIETLPRLDEYVQAEPEQFANVASGELTLRQFVQLARRINDLFAADSGLAGIVVTSGTDTLEELAYFLHLTVRSDRPVVVVGAMRNPSTIGYEGPANLLAGFRVAADPESSGRGVLVVLNDEINSAREVTKTDALRLQTFQSRGYGVLGVVDADRVVYYRQTVKRHTVRSEFDVSRIEELPRVDVLMAYQDAPGDLITAAAEAGAKGIVLATAGAGATSGTQTEGMRGAAERGVLIVMTTRTGNGRVAPRDPRRGAAPAGSRDGAWRAAIVEGEDLLPVKARLLLMLALTRTSNPDEIQRIFSEY